MKKKSQRHLNFYSNVYLSGDKIHYIGYENGERVQYKESFSPVLYARCNEKTEYKTLEGHYVKELPFSSVNDARQFIDEYKYCLLYTSPSPRDQRGSRMPSSA